MQFIPFRIPSSEKNANGKDASSYSEKDFISVIEPFETRIRVVDVLSNPVATVEWNIFFSFSFLRYLPFCYWETEMSWNTMADRIKLNGGAVTAIQPEKLSYIKAARRLHNKVISSFVLFGYFLYASEQLQ